MGKHRWFLGRPNLTAIAVSGIALAFVVTTLVLTSHKVSLYRDALKALDQSGASLALPRSTQYLSNRVGTAVLVAVTPDAEFPVRLALSRTSIATFGLPEQDAFGLGPEPLVRDAALSAGCVLIVTSANEQDVPATPLRALALAQELFPVQVRKWTEGDFRMEARSRVGASGC